MISKNKITTKEKTKLKTKPTEYNNAPSTDLGLVIAIIFAASAIAGSLVFVGIQFANKGTVSAPLDSSTIEQVVKKAVSEKLALQPKFPTPAVAPSPAPANKDIAAKTVARISPKDHVRGDKNAPVTIYEYSDFECPFCKKGYANINEVLKKYPNKVNLVYRHFPLSFHDPMATKEAVASECAAELGGNEAFWKFHDFIYERTTAGGNGLDDNKLATIAKDVGLDSTKFKTCTTSGKYESVVKANIESGSSAGVTGTPGHIILNNKTGEAKFINGAQPAAAFSTVIDYMLNTK